MNNVEGKSRVTIEGDRISFCDLEFVPIRLKIELSFSLEKILGKDYLVPSGKLKLLFDSEPEEVYDLVLDGREPEGFVLAEKLRSYLLVWQSEVGPVTTSNFNESIENIFARYLSSFDITGAKIFFDYEKTIIIISFDSGKGEYYHWPFKALLTREQFKLGVESRISFF